MAMKKVQTLEVRETVGDRFTHVTVKHDDGILEEFDLTGKYAGLHYAWLTMSNGSEMRLAVLNDVILHRLNGGDLMNRLCFAHRDDDGQLTVTSDTINVGDIVGSWVPEAGTGRPKMMADHEFERQHHLPRVASISVAEEYLR